MKRFKNNNYGNNYKEREEENNERRLNIINEIIKKFKIAEKKIKPEDINIKFFEEKKICINECKKIFKHLNEAEIKYILYFFHFIKDNNVEYIINFLDTINTILYHYEYYKWKNPKIKYNNNHFDNYLLNRYDCAYFFTNYLIDRECRELKIDNKLYFNYFPVKCPNKNHKDIYGKNECPYAHNIIEEFYHPFVYKKFKCPRNCNEENCSYYHVNEKDEPIDMETEVDFDSNEIMNLKEVLSSLKINKEDIKKNEKLILLQKNSDRNDFIPSEFNPKTYKIYKCPLGQLCKLDKKLCLNYHDNGDKRRNPNIYKAFLCPNLYEKNKRIKNGKCNNGENCNNAHNLFEYYYHPDKFRTVKCIQEKGGNSCEIKIICPYLHKGDSDYGKGEEERMILDEDLVVRYYKNMIDIYEISLDKEREKLDKIEAKYFCYLCGKRNTNALNEEYFLIDPKENKIICSECAEKKKIKTKEVSW